jgi:hypothetical protein
MLVVNYFAFLLREFEKKNAFIGMKRNKKFDALRFRTRYVNASLTAVEKNK